MKDIIGKTEYEAFMESAKQGMWHKGLCKYGFCSPTTDAKGNPVIPVNEAIRPCEPKYKSDGSYAGIWEQVRILALKYNKRRSVGFKHISPEYTFVPGKSVGY